MPRVMEESERAEIEHPWQNRTMGNTKSRRAVKSLPSRDSSTVLSHTGAISRHVIYHNFIHPLRATRRLQPPDCYWPTRNQHHSTILCFQLATIYSRSPRLLQRGSTGIHIQQLRSILRTRCEQPERSRFMAQLCHRKGTKRRCRHIPISLLP